MWAGRPAWYAAADGCWLKIARLAGRIEPDMREGTYVLRRVAGSNPARSTRISPLAGFIAIFSRRVSQTILAKKPNQAMVSIRKSGDGQEPQKVQGSLKT